MRISDWSSDVCSSDLKPLPAAVPLGHVERRWHRHVVVAGKIDRTHWAMATYGALTTALASGDIWVPRSRLHRSLDVLLAPLSGAALHPPLSLGHPRSEERRVGKECVRTCRSRRSRSH